ncbi:MAG: trehalose operon repressor [Lachnospiraceae bacterium]|nr:trehalose operon repressor [Lachnospiraceae bacterium]
MPAAKFEQIYDSLKGKILSGEYPRDSMLPSEHQLTEEYECSRNTIRRAIAMLAREGYVQSIHGKGVQVIYTPVKQTAFIIGGIETFAESAKRQNLPAVTEVVHFAEIIVDNRISDKTGFPEGAEVYYIQRVRKLDGKPVILDINMLLKSEAPGLTEEIASRSIYEYLENELQMVIVTSNRQINSQRATPADSIYLDLVDYDFVSVVTGQTYNSKGVMFEWTQSRHRPDYFVFFDTAIRKR